MTRLWITEAAFTDGWDSEAVLLTEAGFKSAAQSETVIGKVHRVGTLTAWNFVYGAMVGSVFTAIATDGITAYTCTIYDPITREVIATPTVTNDDDGGVGNDGKFSWGFVTTDTPTAGQWAFEIIATIPGPNDMPICKGWIDILPAVPT